MIRIFEDAFDRLRKYALWLTRVPAVSAVEKIAADLGLAARACAGPGGDVQAGSLAKAVELLRCAQAEHWTVAELVESLGRLVQEDETHDAIPAKPHEAPVVRVMNLHKVKGLEAPVVFLADPTGHRQHPVELHIDRSGDKVRGYMSIEGTVLGSGRKALLALPDQWESFSHKEEAFQQAEALRLRYVAATRAGCRLIISQRENYQNKNPWAFFEPVLGRLTLRLPIRDRTLPCLTLKSRLTSRMCPRLGQGLSGNGPLRSRRLIQPPLPRQKLCRKAKSSITTVNTEPSGVPSYTYSLKPRCLRRGQI